MNDIPWPDSLDERAAGVVLFRRISDEIRFLVLRNARHRTWGFAKGRAEPGESPLSTARREVHEETGIARFELHPDFVSTIDYRVRNGPHAGHRKLVVYFLAETQQEVVMSDEHDSVRWASIEEALRLITHPNLREVLTRAAEKISNRGSNPASPGM